MPHSLPPQNAPAALIRLSIHACPAPIQAFALPLHFFLFFRYPSNPTNQHRPRFPSHSSHRQSHSSFIHAPPLSVHPYHHHHYSLRYLTAASIPVLTPIVFFPFYAFLRPTSLLPLCICAVFLAINSLLYVPTTPHNTLYKCTPTHPHIQASPART